MVIANGSECGEDQGFAPYAEFVNVNQSLLKTLPWWGTLLGNIFSPYLFFNNYPQVTIGSPLTTRTDIKGKFIVNALPDQASQRVYYGEIYVRKKILWTINVNITLFSKGYNSDPSYLPLDNSGGGVRDIQDIESVEGQIKMKINDLSDGQYYLHVTTDMETVTSQIVINR